MVSKEPEILNTLNKKEFYTEVCNLIYQDWFDKTPNSGNICIEEYTDISDCVDYRFVISTNYDEFRFCPPTIALLGKSSVEVCRMYGHVAAMMVYQMKHSYEKGFGNGKQAAIESISALVKRTVLNN